jgi:organic hydroperoxide reductase OsmC/OhrA
MAEAFRCHLEWSGAAAGATDASAKYSRDLNMTFDGPPALPMSAAPAYKGDPGRANPELLLVASLSSCQALTYLFLAARAGIAVTAYHDDADGHLGIVDGRMRVSRVTLRPTITLAAGADQAKAAALIEKAHEQCFISASVTTKISIEPTFKI